MRFVRIQHPDIDGVGTVSETAFLAVYRNKGWTLAEEQPPAPGDSSGDAPGRPQKNDSTQDWRDYAVASGMRLEQADAMSRDELVHYYDTLES